MLRPESDLEPKVATRTGAASDVFGTAGADTGVTVVLMGGLIVGADLTGIVLSGVRIPMNGGGPLVLLVGAVDDGGIIPADGGPDVLTGV